MSLASTVEMDDALTIVDYDDIETLPDDEDFVWDGPDSVSEVDTESESESDLSDISYDSNNREPLDVA